MEKADKMESTDEKKKKQSLYERMRTPSFYIYCNYFLSAWGDWKWQFSVGLYLVHLADKELRLAAIFGFSAAGSVLILGGIIGNWVDKTARLKVVRVSLFLQNMCVMLCALCVCFTLIMHERLETWFHGSLMLLSEAVIIILAVLAQLASVAYKIAIEKDWIVVIAGRDRSKLANLNALTRAIDLMCKIMSPAFAGLVIHFGSLVIGAIFIAAWNFFSVFVEYGLLCKVYQMVPDLANEKRLNTAPKEVEMQDMEEKEPLKGGGGGGGGGGGSDDITNGDLIKTEQKKKEKEAERDVSKLKKEETVIETMLQPFLIVVRGWRVYSRQRVVFAGLALAFLYMTVLGFDSITIGYIYANNLNSGMVGVSMSLAGVTGIMGTIVFTWMRRRIGLERTGLFAFNAEIICLVLCVASIWSPGSLFAPVQAALEPAMVNCTVVNLNGTINGTMSTACLGGSWMNPLNVSIILFLVGVITSRVGLWMSDLVVTQLLQENVKEKERGIVNGVQNSLNMLMDLVKFSLVIVLPRIDTYGYLILLSFTFICFASVLFAFHSRRVRGHLFHFTSLCPPQHASPPAIPVSQVISVCNVDAAGTAVATARMPHVC